MYVSDNVRGRHLLELRNESANLYNLCVYQTLSQQKGDFHSVVCFSARCHPQTRSTFEWSGALRFVWAHMDDVRPGAICRAAQDWPCDSADRETNGVALIREHGAYRFDRAARETPPGSLAIHTDGTVPNGRVAVGLGLPLREDGRLHCLPSLVTSVAPNFTHILEPSINFWITFGDYETGEIIDPALVNNPFPIVFPADARMVRAVLNERNEWHIE